MKIKTHRLFVRLAGLLLSAALLLPVSLPAMAAGRFETNLENLRGITGQWTEERDGFKGVSQGEGDVFALSDTVASDFVFEVKARRISGNNISLVFRSNEDGSNAYAANIDFGLNSAHMFFFGEGGRDIGPGYPLPDPEQKEFELRIEAVGDSINYYVDDRLAVSATDSTYASGRLGLMVYNAEVLYRDVFWQPITEQTLPVLTDLRLTGAGADIPLETDVYSQNARIHATDEVRIQATSGGDTSMTISAYNENGSLLDEIPLEDGQPSPAIPMSDQYAYIQLKMQKAGAEATVTRTIKLKNSAVTPGDVTGDTFVTAADESSMQDFILGRVQPADWQLQAGDLDGDGELTVADILRLVPMMTDEESTVSYLDMVDRMTNLEALALPAEEGERSFEASSYNKSSRYNEETGQYESWDNNDDSGLSDLPRTEDGGWVFADIKGPGALVHLSTGTANSGHVKIFIDGQQTPAVDMAFRDYFGTGEFPYNQPELCYIENRGRNCFIPVTFNESCKVIAYDDWGMYYELHYIAFPEDTQVEPFALPLTPAQQQAIREVNDLFAGDMADLPKADEQAETVEKTVTVPAGGSVDLLDAAGSGAVTGLQIQLLDLPPIGSDGVAADWKALSEMTLSAYWDGEENPSVWSTLGGFFGSATGLNPYESYTLGVKEDGRLYANWYMPFENGAKIMVGNDGDTDYSITYSLTTESLPAEDAAHMLRFHAKWVRAKDPERTDRWPDTPFLTTTGTGRYVGTSLHVYKELGVGDPEGHSDWWWGEGDEKFFVDGEKFPSWFGTGCEDYFLYSWGTWNPYSKAYHSQPFTNGGMWGIGNRLNNRIQIIDNVPFTTSFEANLEKYHRDHYANWVFTDFWYLSKDGVDPYGPVSLEERTSYYEDPYPAAADFYEGEDLKIIESTGMMKAETQEMSDFSFAGQWSNNHQLIFKAEGSDAYVKCWINVEKEGDYLLSARYSKAPDFGVVQHLVDGQPLGAPIDLYNPSVILTDDLSLGAVHMTAGLHEFTIRVTGKNGASTGYFCGLDYLRIKEYDGTAPIYVFYEGEALEIVDQTEGLDIYTQDMGDLCSGRAHKLMFSQKQGDFMTLRFQVPKEGDYIVTGGFTRANDFGTAQHSIDGKRMGNPIELYDGGLLLTETVIGRIHLTAGQHELKVEMVDKAPDSRGYVYALDTLSFQEYTPSDHADGKWFFEGEELEVASFPEGSRPFVQNLFWISNKDEWSQNCHLISRLQKPADQIELRFTVPEDGRYALAAALTMANDFGIFQLSLDGQPIGEPVDTYHADGTRHLEQSLGAHDLTAGTHTLTIACTGKNEASRGYLFGIDWLELTKVGGQG